MSSENCNSDIGNLGGKGKITQLDEDLVLVNALDDD
jgi:hypothetical protein